MYKWPQGRVIRTICLLFTLLVVCDLGYSGAYSQLAAVGTGSYQKQVVLGTFFIVLAVSALIAGVVAAGFHHRAVEFLIEVEQEMVRVEWPTMNNLVRSTIIIAIAVVIMALLILGIDSINFYFINQWWPDLFVWITQHLFS